MAKVKLPSRLLDGHVIRVQTVNCVEVSLHLPFGISVVKSVLLEDVELKDVPPKLRQAAHHCLIVLLGGKDVVVHTSDENKRDGFVLGRVYLNERVYGAPAGMAVPFGLDAPMLEVSAFYRWLSGVNYDITAVKAVLNGSNAGVGAAAVVGAGV